MGHRGMPERARLAIHLVALAAICLVALLPRLLALRLAVAPARDMIRYVEAARAFESLPFLEALRTIDCHPLFPCALLGTQRLLLAAGTADGPDAWLRAGQCVSLAAYLVFLIAAYAAGTRLIGPLPAALGCGALAIVPRQVRYSCDVLCDSSNAALWMGSLAVLVGAKPRPRTFAAAGSLAALAFCTRPESLALPVAFVAALAAMHLRRCEDRPSLPFLAGLTAYLASWLIIAGGYVAATGRLSPRQTAAILVPALASPGTVSATPASAMRLVSRPFDSPDPTLGPAVDLGAVIAGQQPEPVGPLRALACLVGELFQETQGWLAALAVTALLVARRRRIPVLELWVLTAIVVHAGVLMWLRMRAGYLSGRYLMPVLPFVAMVAMLGAASVVSRLRTMAPLPWEASWSPSRLVACRVALGWGILGTTAVGLSVPGWFEPLHRFRDGQMRAAHWLKRHSRPNQRVFDPIGLVSFFASRERLHPNAQVVDGAYAVIDPSCVPDMDGPTRSAMDWVVRSWLLAAAFPKEAGTTAVGVYVYEAPGVETQRENGRPTYQGGTSSNE